MRHAAESHCELSRLHCTTTFIRLLLTSFWRLTMVNPHFAGLIGSHELSSHLHQMRAVPSLNHIESILCLLYAFCITRSFSFFFNIYNL